MNALMEQGCDAPEQEIELTRARAYQSNDQAWVGASQRIPGTWAPGFSGNPVEQKNGMLIRRVVGYERLVVHR